MSALLSLTHTGATQERPFGFSLRSIGGKVFDSYAADRPDLIGTARLLYHLEGIESMAFHI
jgi:hypothetical protein